MSSASLQDDEKMFEELSLLIVIKLLFETIQVEVVANIVFIYLTEEIVIFKAAKPLNPTTIRVL